MTQEPAKPQAPAKIDLAAGHQLAISEDGQHLTLTNVQGLRLNLQLTADGPVLDLDAPNLTIRNQGNLHLEAEHVHLKSRGDMVQEVGGHFVQRTSGDHKLQIRDDLHVEAQAMALEAKQGELDFKASDDISLQGLRVLHNVPRKEELEAALEKVETFGDHMALPAYDPNSPQRLPKSKPRPREDWDTSS